MSKFEIQIEDGVEIPKREAPTGPRGSVYPLEQMREGQSFAINIVGEEGHTRRDGVVLTAEEDAKRKAAQKQSYFSQLGKRLGISVVTRYNAEAGTLRVWHNGPRSEADESADEGSDNLLDD